MPFCVLFTMFVLFQKRKIVKPIVITLIPIKLTSVANRGSEYRLLFRSPKPTENSLVGIKAKLNKMAKYFGLQYCVIKEWVTGAI